jgi:simple sugar transport system ATP-binding protein
LDEPTAILTPQEARELFKTLRRMADEGRSVIFISHKLNETMENADRITVLKGGRVEDTLCAKDATIPRLTKAVVGSRTICDFVSKEQKPIEGSALINVENLWVKNDKGLDALKDVSFEMYSGEIFAIAGVAGNGQRELAESLAGLRKVASGKIFMDGKDLTDSGAKQRIVEGVSFIPEDRLKMGLIPEISLDKNAILKEFRNSSYSKYGIMNRTSIRATSQDHIDNFDIKCGGANLPVSMMSGGNQQKLLVAREVNMNPRFIIAAYPVRGLDIGATETINQILLNERNKGTCVLLISEDLDEIFDVADRVAVLCDGVLMGIREICHTDFEEIGCLMSGENTEKDGSNG